MYVTHLLVFSADDTKAVWAGINDITQHPQSNQIHMDKDPFPTECYKYIVTYIKQVINTISCHLGKKIEANSTSCYKKSMYTHQVWVVTVTEEALCDVLSVVFLLFTVRALVSLTMALWLCHDPDTKEHDFSKRLTLERNESGGRDQAKKKKKTCMQTH